MSNKRTKKQKNKPRRRVARRKEQTPRWQPVSEVFFLGSLIDEQVESARHQLALLERGRETPHLLDDATMVRIGTLFTEQQEMIDLYVTQCARWRRADGASAEQLEEVARLEALLPRWRSTTEAILALHDEMSEGTIEKVLARDDLSLGMEALGLKVPEFEDTHIAIAERLDTRVNQLLAHGGDEALVANLYELMDAFKQLFDAVGEEGAMVLGARYPGFGQLLDLLGAMAQAIHDGELEVPPDH